VELFSNWMEYSAFFISIFMALVAIAATMISYSVYAGSTSPDVVVHLEQDPHSKSILNLVIQNIGKGSAKNIVFTPESPLPQDAFGIENAHMPKQMDRGPIITGIPYLAPNAKRVMMLGQYSGLENWLKDKSIVINIKCERANKVFGISKFVHTSSSIDIFSFATSESSDNSNAKGIKDELKKLNKEIAAIKKLIYQHTNES
jgi:hypothetical protein